MKNTLALVLMVFGSFGAFADSISIKGEMQCKVKDQIILETEDGISTRYQGFENDMRIGETLVVSYSLFDTGVPRMQFFVYRKPKRGEKYKPGEGTIILNIFYEQKGEFLQIKDNELGFRAAHLDEMDIDPSERTTFGVDKMHIQNTSGAYRLNLRRYYKNDWEGFFTKNTMDEFSTHAATLNCRQETDVIEEIIKTINKLYFSKVDNE